LTTLSSSIPCADLRPAAALHDEPREVMPWHRYLLKTAGNETGAAASNLDEPARILPLTRRGPAPGRGRFENNLSRKGVFLLQPDRASGNAGGFDFNDLVGRTSLAVPLGALGSSEMDLIVWVMGRWERDRDFVQFTLREACRAFGLSWNGQVGMRFKERLHRIKAATITGRVWDARERKHTTTHFSVFDLVRIEGKRFQMRGSEVSPATVTIKLSDWLLSQLQAGQYSDFDWVTYRTRLTTPFSRRLYLLLESHQGEEEGKFLRLPIGRALGNTLGTSDATANPTRLRRRLREAGEEICSAGVSYLEVGIRVGTMRWEYWLEVRRSRTWLQARIRSRRRALAEAQGS
jgi:hypothetical protein